MRPERIGSYSIDTTLPGITSLSRLKSITLRRFFAPPPRWRTVILPPLLPAFCFQGRRMYPSRRVTTAFFHEGVANCRGPILFVLPLTHRMLTEATLTLKAFSTAPLTSRRLAWGSTSKAYLLLSPRRVIFSVIRGRRRT